MPLSHLERELGRNAGKIIEALVTHAKSQTDVQFERQLSERARRLLKSHADAIKKQSYYRIIGLPEGNGHKWAGPNPTKLLNDRHITLLRNLLHVLGFSSKDLSSSSPAAFGAWVDAALKAITEGDTASLVNEIVPVENTSHRRVVPRTSCRDQVIAKLNGVGVVAIVGMSGTGKTVLARQVLAASCGRQNPAVEIHAREMLAPALSLPSPREPAEVDQIALCARILGDIAVRLGRSRRRTFGSAFDTALRAALRRWPNPDRHDEPRTLHEQEKHALLRTLHANRSWSAFLKAAAEHVSGIRDVDLLTELAGILRPEAGDLTVFVDDVWSFPTSAFVTSVLFGNRDGSPAPRLLVTSVEKTAVDFLVPGVSVQLDAANEAGEPSFDSDFAREVVLAWAAPESDLDSADATRAFGDARLSDQLVKRDIDLIITRLGGHPLALAALAATWRVKYRHAPEFWKAAPAALDAKPDRALALPPRPELWQAFDERHRRVLNALHFAWSVLSDQEQQQYFDLAIAPSVEPIDHAVFHAFWSAKAGRERSLEPPEIAQPLQRFADKSLLQAVPGSNRYVLHALHRMMIETILGPDGLVERHRAFLKSCGLIGDDNRLALDEHRHFKLNSDDRTILYPLLHDATDNEREAVSRYLANHLPRHVSQLDCGDPQSDNLARALTTFRFLQARLDTEFQYSRPSSPAGNIDRLISAFDGVSTKSTAQLLRTIRIAARPLASDRRQLAAQLLARVSNDTYPEYARLRQSARTWAPASSFSARFPFLPYGEGPLIALLQSTGEAPQWLQARLGRPTILTWSDRTIELWDVATAQRLPLPPMQHRSRIRGAKALSSQDTRLILSWTDHQICLWDLITGERRGLIELDANPSPLEHSHHDQPVIHNAKWVTDQSGSHWVLYWTQGSIFAWDGAPNSSPLLIAFTTQFSIRDVQFIQDPTMGPLLLIFNSPNLHQGIRALLWDITEQRTRWAAEGCGAIWLPNPSGKPDVIVWRPAEISIVDPEVGTKRSLVYTGFEAPHLASWMIRPQGAARLGRKPTAEPSKNLKPFDHGLWIEGAHFSGSSLQDGLITLWSKREILHWDLQRERLVLFRRPPAENSSQEIAYQCAIEPEHRPAIVATPEREHAVLLWDALSGEPRPTEASPTARLLEEATSIDNCLGAPAIMGAKDGYIWLFDRSALNITPPTENRRALLQPMQWIDYANNGALFCYFSGQDESTTQVQLLDTQNCRALLRTPIELEPRKYTLPQELPGSSVAHWVAGTCGQPKILTLASGTISLWDPTRNPPCPDVSIHHSGGGVCHVEWVAKAPGGPAILSTSYDSIEFWCPTTMSRRAPCPMRFGKSDVIRGATWLQLGHVPRILSWSDKEIRLWDPETATVTLQIPAEISVGDAEWIPNVSGRPAILTSCYDVIALWDPSDRSMIWAHVPPRKGLERERLLGLQWLEDGPGGPAILSWSEAGLRFWDAATGRIRAELPRWRTNGVPAATFEDQLGRSLWPLSATHDALGVQWISCAPVEPAILVWSYDEIRIWRPWNPQPLSETMCHQSAICGARWIVDRLGQPAILSWGWDGSIRLWDPAMTQERKRVDLESPPVHIVCAPTRKSTTPAFAVYCADGSIGVFNI